MSHSHQVPSALNLALRILAPFRIPCSDYSRRQLLAFFLYLHGTAPFRVFILPFVCRKDQMSAVSPAKGEPILTRSPPLRDRFNNNQAKGRLTNYLRGNRTMTFRESVCVSRTVDGFSLFCTNCQLQREGFSTHGRAFKYAMKRNRASRINCPTL